MFQYKIITMAFLDVRNKRNVIQILETPLNRLEQSSGPICSQNKSLRYKNI